MSVQALEPKGGNLYRPHAFMVSSGEFWRCKHGTTGFAAGLEWVGCAECAALDPEAFARWNGEAAPTETPELAGGSDG